MTISRCQPTSAGNELTHPVSVNQIMLLGPSCLQGKSDKPSENFDSYESKIAG
jgi:hypothetical protein